MPRFTSFSLTLAPDATARQALARHAGCRRFAYNLCVAELKRALDARAQSPDGRVPRSSFDFINFINSWRKAQLASHRTEGKLGKPWCYEVCAQVWEEAAVDASRAYRRFLDGRTPGASSRPGFPRFRSKNRDMPTARIRAHGNSITVAKDSIRLPILGELAVRGSTRRLRRLLVPGRTTRAKLLFVTVTCVAGRWRARVNLEAQALHPAMREKAPQDPWVGIDLGLTTFAVAANADGEALWDAHGPKTHGHVALEDLHIAGMLRNRRLARHIADCSWGQFARFVTYKGSWYGCEVAHVPRFEPTTKRCSRCDAVVPPLPLSQRVFTCPHCALVLDRDVNAAANCARWGQAHACDVAGKPLETENVRGAGSSGRPLAGTVKRPAAKRKRPNGSCSSGDTRPDAREGRR